ncbi:hypothetical protein [Catenuloplanes japonicus]|uniref:hypothetical protein n=1 Tax=Catenuloplanes japonicus TaxID=33876 RepID=UPI0005273C6C|nr:hypothetical protein [Catenuloplanes japonicus]
MSTHTLIAIKASPAVQVTAGWDGPLGTFFGSVVDNGDEIFAVGTTRRKVTDPAVVIDGLRPYALIPDSLRATLRADAWREGNRQVPAPVSAAPAS